MAFLVDRARCVAHLGALMIFGMGVAVFAAPLHAQEQSTTTEPAATQTPAPRGTNLSLGSFKVTADMPIDVVSDELHMDQNVNTAIFTGNVQVEHGDMQLNSAKVVVEYGRVEGSTNPNEIIRVTATGDVRMKNPTETAESDEAVYTLADRQVVMTGNVVVTQGATKVAGERMVVNLDDGTAVMQGRVHTIIGSNKPKDSPSDASEGVASGDSSQ
jgi:lipopolysaccharide export system protein LptA